jgi:NDP-sugar pyrophosphorylase family protein
LSLLRNKLVEENFLLTNCDVLSQINYKNLLEFHIKNKADLTVATRKHVSQSQYGEINLKGMAIKNIIEKPKKDLIINSGIYVVKKNCLKFLKYNYQTDMNEFIIKLIKKNKKVIAYPFYESWFDLGTKEQLKISKNYV